MKKILFLVICGLITLSGCTKTSEETTPPPKEEVKDEIKKVSMSFTGDLLFEQGLYDSQDNYQFGTYFDQVKPYLQGDIVVGNQEVPIAGKDMDVSGVAFSFNAPEEVAQQLPKVGFDVMTLSNNHSYDRGFEGAVKTIQNLQDNGITTVGMYANKEDADKITVIEKNGIRIAFLAYTYDTNEYIDNDHAFVVKTFLNDAREFDQAHQDMLKADVAKAKEQADVVIAAMHWGNEFTYSINSTQLQATDVLNEAGVNLIIGNHPHTLQTMEVVTNDKNDNETIVFYSLGNFVSSAADVGRASETFTNMYEIGGIVNLDITLDPATKKVTMENMVLTPIVNHFEHGYTNFALMPFSSYTDEFAQKHYQREYSSDFNITWLKQQIDSLFHDKITMN